MKRIWMLIIICSVCLSGCESEKNRIELLTEAVISKAFLEASRFEEWNEFNGDGYKLVSYIFEGEGGISEEICEGHKLRYGLLSNINTSIEIVKGVIDKDLPLCFRIFTSSNDEFEAIYIQGGYLYYYLGIY